jgi:valyl-tRNA synthetase
VTKLAPRAPLTLHGWPAPEVASLVESLGSVTIAAADAGNGAGGELRLVDTLALGNARIDVLAPGGAGEMRPRYERELANAQAEAERARRKLADTRFVERAPARLVAAEREKAERFEREAAELRARLADLGA